MTYLMLFYEFFKTGLFSVGGGLATIPFLTQMSVAHPDWFSMQMLADMIAVSESTPGAIGVNMATYVGYTVGGVFGAILATFALVLPAFIAIMLVARVLQKYQENPLVENTFFALRPAVTGLIAAAGYTVLKLALTNAASTLPLSLDWRCCLLFAGFVACTQLKQLKKLHPTIYIGIGALAGVVFSLGA